MRVSDLMNCTVIERNGRSLGRVRDVHVVQDGAVRASGERGFRVHGLVTGRFAIGTRLGYVSRAGFDANDETKGPLPIRALFRWLHRNAAYVAWHDIVEIKPGEIVVQQGAGDRR
jgi:hypothetical protein